MGKAISYCYKCSSLLREDDFHRGKAFQDGDRMVCVRCAPHLSGSPPGPRSSSAIRVSSTTRLRTAASSEGAPPKKASGFKGVLLLVGGLLAVAGIVLLLARRPSGEPVSPPPSSEEPRRSGAGSTVPAPAALSADQELLRSARTFAKEHPGDLDGRLREMEKVVWEFGKTGSAVEAKKEIEALKSLISRQVSEALATLEKEIQEPLGREAFGVAIRTVEDAAGRLPTTEWHLATAKRSREIFDQARALHAELLARLDGLAAEGKVRDIQEAAKRVRGWEIPVLVERMDAAVAPLLAGKLDDPGKPSLPADAKPRSEASKAYLSGWERGMAKFVGWDFGGARDELSRASAVSKEAEVASEAREDLEVVQKLEEFLKSAIAEMVAAPPPVLTVELQDGRKASGRVLQVTADRLEVGSKASVFAEWSELTAASLVALPRKTNVERRLQALLCLVEGEPEAARGILGADIDTVPAKYWTWAPKARAAVLPVDPREKAARALFYDAEREFRSMRTRGPAAEKYRSLRKDYLGTALVRSAADRIERRSDAGRDYYLPALDLECAGTLKRTKAGRLESDADSDDNLANQNYAEAEFFALPETPYRAWVLAGGCCQPVFTFLWQGTELTEYNPRTKKVGSADIGGALAAYAKFSIRGLKPTHDPKTPKTPARWEWIEVPLPKYSAPGPKRIRIMTDQKGFGVAAVVVSSVRKSPPREDELKELERARAADLPGGRVDPDLVAWWVLDEGAGTTAADSSGHGHGASLSGTCTWRAGKLGGALEFDGMTSAVSIPDAPDLRITGDITIAFWVIKRNPAGDWQRLVGKGDMHRRTFGVWTGGGQNRILWQQYGESDHPVLNISGTRDLPLGEWAHVAVTIQGTQAAIYLNGVKDVETVRSGTPLTSAEPVTLGSSFHAPLAGSLGDVRIYRRALSPEEIREVVAGLR